MRIHLQQSSNKEKKRSAHRQRVVLGKASKYAAYRRMIVLGIVAGVLSVGSARTVWSIARPDSVTAGVTATEGLSQIFQQFTTLPTFLNRQKIKSQLPTLSFELSYEKLHQLQQQRTEAIDKGAIDQTDFISATLTYRAASMPIDLRLKPGLSDALNTQQWPYQIEIENDDRPLGMKRFSLYPAPANSFLPEQFWLAHLQKENLLARRSQLVKVSLNGERRGVFVLEDEFSKELLHSQDRPEGLFLRYQETSSHTANSADTRTGEDTRTVEIEPTRPGHIEKYFGLQRQEESATALLRGFSQGRLPADTAFDIEATARFIAIANLWPNAAALSSPQAYFYYNPVSAKLEPVGFHTAANTDPVLPAAPPNETSRWVAQLMSDPVFAEEYEQVQSRLSDPSYLSQLQTQLSEQLQSQTAIIQPIQSKVSQLWQQTIARATSTHNLLDTASKRRLSNTHLATTVSQRVLGQQVSASPPVKLSQLGRSLQSPTIEQLLSQHSFLRWDKTNKALNIEPGTWQVEGDLIIPAGTSLKATAGTQLEFQPGAILLSRSPLSFIGSSDRPIVLSSQFSNWGGLEIWAADKTSELHHVRIQQTQGGILSYRSAISLVAAQIEDTQSRDALKLFQSPFYISNTLFQNLKDDAIDTESSNGEIEDSQFSNIGGDGIDLSNSEVSLQNLTLSNITDKAISVGQNSRLRANNITVSDAKTAVASLDGSNATLDNLSTINIDAAAIVAYRQRLGYAGSVITARDSTFTDTPYDAIAQDGSRITLNEETLMGNQQSSYLLNQLEILDQ